MSARTSIGYWAVVLAAATLPGCAWWHDTFGRGSTTEQRSSMTDQSSARARMNIPVPVSPSIGGAVDATLRSTVGAALKGDMGALAANLVPEDQGRLSQLSAADRDEISRTARRYDSDWNSRYGRAVDWNSDPAFRQVFTDYQISRGKDARHVLVTIPAAQGAPRVTLSMRDLGNNTWRIDAPDSLSSFDLKNRLDSTYSDLSAAKNQWPGDSNLAARIAAQRALSIFSRT